ncbi:unnamed protein product [Rodentolepis nana]|uniref:Trm112 family protein n=1 Tax=Rodentolepis nana TaxID=102285 RepID=A0A0R3TMP3_RODNA|nr:unnamed protein product [Rodentolepis nana]
MEVTLRVSDLNLLLHFPFKDQIVLNPQQPEVRLPKEVYQSLIIKSSGSATRLIRLLMKHFFSQDELAASSLSGEGIYKRRLKPDITEAIKLELAFRDPSSELEYARLRQQNTPLDGRQ